MKISQTLSAVGFCIGLMSVSLTSVTAAQESESYNRAIPVEMANTTEHKATINGKKITYTATAGMQPVWNEEGHPIATLQFTYYEKANVKNKEKRPLVISFNGGPGSASVWMHIAYTGPKILNIDEEGYPLQPYGVKDNPYSILDVADIVYVNPVNTGYSRVLPDKEGKMPGKDEQKNLFFGVNADIAYLADWLNTFVSRQNRWRSPKFLIGESYGTTRVSGLAKALQQNQWMYLNGVILVSPTELGIAREGTVESANRLPYFAAAAWFHNKLAPEYQNMALEDFLPQVESFTLNTLLPALAKGAWIDEDEKRAVTAQYAAYSGLSTTEIEQNNLDVSTWYFWKALLRDEGKTIGRLDSRYLGIDEKDVGDNPDYNAELSAWLHAFTPAINDYLRNDLGFVTDTKYNMFGPVHPWDRENNHTGEDLRAAMAENPFLKVMIQSGYYDGATNYFDAKYTMTQIDRSGKMKDRLQFKGYRSGHMMYLRYEDLKAANEDIRAFIESATPSTTTPAKYQR
ncbi:S10 family peptidase [Aestuariibacter sp. A3R04]|uniref:S10 family peptidase n=1 Tax=Aestuariibacter sp. A3R04 TaxID=2841571 RepID=UPI001C0A1464|nr:carboxypeptidase [Aestuariibacter sp. A3R04]MBU3021713.1 carboxypeptidase [Aestuariibacter sp. A3R04]